MNWVIETGIETEEANRLISSVEKLGKKVFDVSFIPFASSFIGQGPPFKEERIFHGSLQACNHVYKKVPAWKVFYDPIKYHCSYYYPRLEGLLWNEECIFLPIGMLDYRKDFLFRKLGVMGTIFIRPDSPNKEFTGTLLNINTWEDDKKLIYFSQNPPETMCVVASPATCYNEMRFFVGNGTVLTGSYYMKDKKGFKEEIVESSPEMQTAQELLNKAINRGFVPPDNIWAMDICCGKEKVYYILEIGPFSGSGFYQSNTDIIVKYLG